MPELVPHCAGSDKSRHLSQSTPRARPHQTLLALLLAFILVAATLVSTSRPAAAATLDSRVTFYAESHRKPTTCFFGRLTAQGSAGRPQGVPGKKVLIQRKKKNVGWRTVATARTDRRGWYSRCTNAGYNKRKGYHRVAVKPYTIRKGHKGTRDASRSAYLWR